MRTVQLTGTLDSGWQGDPAPAGFAPQLVLWFGARQADGAQLQAALQARFPTASVVGCSTGGEIVRGEVLDDSVLATAIEFEQGRVQVVSADDATPSESEAIGERLALRLHDPQLRGVIVFSDGLRVSGTSLGRGLTKVLGAAVPVCGALAGDGARFQQTWVACNAPPASGRVVAIGLYGEGIDMHFGTGGGWERFGPERQITRSADNCLFELDGQPALSLYKKYLGDEASGLPGSALLFPLFVRPAGGGGGVTRTVLGIDERQESLNFAGDLPTGHTAQLMHGSFERMISGAAESTRKVLAQTEADGGVVLLMSCVGRKLVLGQRASEEVEAAIEQLPRGTPAFGFYSYGSLAPTPGLDGTHFHNQTMTAVLIREPRAG